MNKNSHSKVERFLIEINERLKNECESDQDLLSMLEVHSDKFAVLLTDNNALIQFNPNPERLSVGFDEKLTSKQLDELQSVIEFPKFSNHYPRTNGVRLLLKVLNITVLN